MSAEPSCLHAESSTTLPVLSLERSLGLPDARAAGTYEDMVTGIGKYHFNEGVGGM